MKQKTLPAIGAAALLALAGFGLAGSAAAAPADAPPVTDVPPYGEPTGGDALNGKGVGPGKNHTAGSVGNADTKNPPGQVKKFADDPDYGYECDGNEGVGQGNPAHSGCGPQ